MKNCRNNWFFCVSCHPSLLLPSILNVIFDSNAFLLIICVYIFSKTIHIFAHLKLHGNNMLYLCSFKFYFLSFNYVHTCGATLSYFIVFYYIDIYLICLFFHWCIFKYNKCCNRHPWTYLFIHMRKVFLAHVTHYRHVKKYIHKTNVWFWCCLAMHLSVFARLHYNKQSLNLSALLY